MDLESMKSEGAAKLESASEAMRRGAKGMGRQALLLRQSATEHPLLSAAIGAAVAGAVWAVASGARRQQRQARLAAGLAVLGGVLHKLSRNGQLARGLDGARKLGKGVSKWGKNQSLVSYARDNAGPALQALLPVLLARLVSARKRLN